MHVPGERLGFSASVWQRNHATEACAATNASTLLLDGNNSSRYFCTMCSALHWHTNSHLSTVPHNCKYLDETSLHMALRKRTMGTHTLQKLNIGMWPHDTIL